MEQVINKERFVSYISHKYGVFINFVHYQKLLNDYRKLEKEYLEMSDKIKCNLCNEELELIDNSYDSEFMRTRAMCPNCGLTTLFKLKGPELRNYIVETDASSGRKPEFFIITAKSEEEAKAMAKNEISDGYYYNCNITGVKLLEAKDEGIKLIAYSCC